jgi:hypothetical protein
VGRLTRSTSATECLIEGVAQELPAASCVMAHMLSIEIAVA